MEETMTEVLPFNSLEELKKVLPTFDKGLLNAMLNSCPPEVFAEAGRKIATPRITTESTRIYGLGYQAWNNLTPEQQDVLVGFSLELLAVGVELAIRGRDLEYASRSGTGTSEAEQKARELDAKTAWELGIKLRDQGFMACRQVAAQNSTMRQRADAAAGTAGDHEELANGLQSLATYITTLLSSTDDNVKALVKGARLTPAYAKKLENQGKKVLETGRAAKGAVRRNVDQGEVDVMDGVNLHVLGEVIRAFEEAHELDPAIPRLVPIGTRRALGMMKKAKKASEPKKV